MNDILTKQDKKFVKKVAETGNLTKAVQEAYEIEDAGYASVKGQRLIGKDRIQKALAERLPDDLLEEKHLALLNKTEKKYDTEGNMVSEEIDTNAVSKGLDMAYKVKGSYAPDKNINMNVNINSIDATNPKVLELIDELRKANEAQ